MLHSQTFDMIDGIDTPPPVNAPPWRGATSS